MLQEELVDRFGTLPTAAQALLETHRLRIDAAPLGVQKIDATPDTIVITFGQSAQVDPAKVIRLIQSDPRYRLVGNEKLRCDTAVADISKRTRVIREILAGIAL